eukprot:scaffold16074_cov18-Tisochrysis_lutea.AAC.1
MPLIQAQQSKTSLTDVALIKQSKASSPHFALIKPRCTHMPWCFSMVHCFPDHSSCLGALNKP